MGALCGASTCHWHQILPTLTVPKSDLLPAPLLTHPPLEEQDEEGEIWVPRGLLGFLCRH